MIINYPESVPPINDPKTHSRNKVRLFSDDAIPFGCLDPKNWDDMVQIYSKRRHKR